MSHSTLSIPAVVDSTIKKALHSSAGPGRGESAFSIMHFAKNNTFTMLGIIALALVVAVGIYIGVKKWKETPAKIKEGEETTSEEALLKNDFLDEPAKKKSRHQKRQKSSATPEEEEEEKEEEDETKADPNFTTLDELTAPDES